MGATGGAPVHAPAQRSWRDVGGCVAWLVLIVLVAGVLQLAGASTGFACDVEVSPPKASVLPLEQATSDQLTKASFRSTTAAPARYAHDAATVARSFAHEISAAVVDCTRLGDVLKGSAPQPFEVRGTSTTPGLCFVAPSGALDDVANGGRRLPFNDPDRVSGINSVLGDIDAGRSFPHRQDGSVFGNREGLLPQQAPGYYREYTVPTPGATNRGARRLVVR